MTDLSTGSHSHQQIIEYIKREHGVEPNPIRVYLCKNNVPTRLLKYYSSHIECDKESQNKYIATFQLQNEWGIDWTQDRIQPFYALEMGGVSYEWPLTPPLMLGTPKREADENGILLSTECYDESLILSNNSLKETITVKRGTPYIGVLDDLFALAGFTMYSIVPSEKVFQYDTDFSEGTRLLTLINTLLEEMNYIDLEPDKSGIFVGKPYEDPFAVDPQIHYSQKDLRYPYSTEKDIVNKHNVYVGYYTNPDTGATLRSVYTNESPSSPTSIQRLGYTITAPPQAFNISVDAKVENLSAVEQTKARQAALDDAVKIMAEEGIYSYDYTQFSTKPMPHHEVGEVISAESADGLISGVYLEIKWTIDAAAEEAKMTHYGRSLAGEE